jgi:hypothetical protein
MQNSLVEEPSGGRVKLSRRCTVMLVSKSWHRRYTQRRRDISCTKVANTYLVGCSHVGWYLVRRQDDSSRLIPSK